MIWYCGRMVADPEITLQIPFFELHRDQASVTFFSYLGSPRRTANQRALPALSGF
jgi:hypothetical protein